MNIAQQRHLISEFRALKESEKFVLQYLAFCDYTVSKSDLIRNIMPILQQEYPEEVLRPKNILSLYTSFRNIGLIVANHNGVSCAPQIIECVACSAIQAGVAKRLAADIELHDSGRYHWRSYYDPGKLRREFSLALFEGNQEGCQRIYNEYRNSHGDFCDGSPLAQILAQTECAEILENGPPVFLLVNLPAAIEKVQFDHLSVYPMAGALERFVFALDDQIITENMGACQQLSLLIVVEHWLCGTLTEEIPILQKLSGYHLEAALGVVAFFSQQFERAIERFELALNAMRKTTAKRKLFFNNWVGMVFFYALIRSDSPANLERALVLLADCRGKVNRSLHQSVFEKLEWMVRLRFYPEDGTVWPYGFPWSSGAEAKDEGLMDIWAKTLIDADATRQFKDVFLFLQALQYQLTGSPHIQHVTDVEALHGFLAPKKRPTKKSPLRSSFVFAGEDERWRLALYSLAHIGQEEGKTKKKDVLDAASKRMSWLVSFDEYGHMWTASPILQTRSKNGRWNKGKSLNIAQSQDVGFDKSFFTEKDERAIGILLAEAAKAAKAKNSRYHGYESTNNSDVIYALAGHPSVFFDAADRVPVEIEIETPVVQVMEKGEEVLVQLVPRQPCPKGFQIDWHSANVIRVVRFSAQQLELLKILSDNGLMVPKGALSQLASAIGHVETMVEVHSHVKKVGTVSAHVEAKQQINLRVRPYMEGVCAHFLVYPLGTKGPSFVPGLGARHVFANIDSSKHTTTRDLQTEASALDFLCDALGLNNVDQEEDGLFYFGEQLDALAFLSELERYNQDATSPLIVEWPKGVKLSCSRKLFPKDFSLQINQKRKWLSLNGNLTVSDELVVNVAQVMEQLGGEQLEYVQLSRGQFVRLSKSLRKFLRHLTGVGELQKDGSIQAAPASAVNVRILADEAGGLEANSVWEATLKRIDENAALDAGASIKVPAGLKATLRDYQREGFKWLHRLSLLQVGACLADDMGLGKTVQTLALLLERLAKSEKPALIVAPVSVIAGWVLEVNRFAPTLKTVLYEGKGRASVLASIQPRQILLTSYGLLQRDGAKLAAVAFDTIVLDEAQFIKNKDSARAKAAFKLVSDFKMVTTGTPVENRLSEFWSIFHFINPGLLGAHKLFVKQFEKSVQIHGSRSALETLRWMVKPFLLRRTKEETLEELPPKTEIVRYCEMSKQEAAFYELHRRRALASLKNADSTEQMMALITSLTTLRQAACHPQLVEPKMDLESAKLECLKTILTELKAGNHQALIFSQFVKFLKIVRNWLEEAGISYQYIDGSINIKKRSAAVDAFQSGASDLFLISTRAGGFGLNLTAADYVVHLDPWWNPAVEDQASDRVHRIGQHRPVTVYKLVTRQTVEEKVLQMHGEKRELAQGLLSGSDAVASMDMQQLVALLAQ